MKEGKTPSQSRTEVIWEVSPPDTNASLHLHGGVLLYWMDIAGGICAKRHSGRNVVTMLVGSVSFKKPIFLGNIVRIIARPTRTFNTSIEIRIDVFKEDITSQTMEHTNTAYFVYVAIDENNRPVKVPPVIPETPEELEEYEEALKRREFNLSLSLIHI